jgi:hypothetical protein
MHQYIDPSADPYGGRSLAGNEGAVRRALDRMCAMNSSIGCNAGVVVCQAENNTPAVGKDEVIREREMHWLRIDRYLEGDPNVPES